MPRIARDPVNDFVRNRIRILRLSKKLSTSQLAALSGIPEGSYCCLESGFSRISISNLQRITRALGTSILDVWPQPMQPLDQPCASATDRPSRDGLRFREICSLTNARGAALLSRGSGEFQVLLENNLAREEKCRLLRLLEQGRRPPQDWLVYEKTQQGKTICLALHKAVLDGRLGVLAELYMSLWLATYGKESGVRNQESGRKRPKAGRI